MVFKMTQRKDVWGLGLCYVGISLVVLVFRWYRWYFVGSVGVRYLTPYFGYIIFYSHVS